MFESMTVGVILRDLRSIKVPPATRKFINEAREYFESKGGLPDKTEARLRQICNKYNKQMKELHAARARARKTNGLKAMGMTVAEAQKLIEMRKAAVETRERDVGF